MSIRVPNIEVSEDLGPMNEFESIADKAPAIAAEAYGWDPKEVSSSEHRIKRQFKCHLGHIWEGRIYDRVRLGSGCQVCANRIVLTGFNDLGTTHPELAAQADGWDPGLIHKGVSKKLPWKCSLGHTWLATVNARTGQRQGCPYCSNKRILAGFNDLPTIFPEVASQAHNWDPSGVTASDKRVVEWLCPLGHISSQSIVSKTRYPNCRVCTGRELQVGVTDLASTNPEIAAEANGWDPTLYLRSSTELKSWRCKEGHIYEKRIHRRIVSGCPFCGGKQVLEGFNDLKSQKPNIASEAFGWDPATVSWGSKKVMIWKCPEGHKYDMAVSLRTGRRPQNCPICSGMRIEPGFNDLATRYPEFAAEAFGWDPTKVSPGTHKVLDWKCKEGHVFRVSPNQRTSRTSNCPTCANLIIEVGFNDLATTHPELALQAFGWDPRTIGAGSSRRLAWRCQEGHVWDSTPVNRSWNQTGCPICVNQLLLKGYNDLLTLFPEIALEADGWDPSEVMAGAKKTMPWRCPAGHKYRSLVQNRTLNGTGCAKCAKSGFNQSDKGYLYFLRHDLWGLYQIGITNVPEKRLASHARLGWEVLEVRGPMDGVATLAWETALLRMLKSQGAELGNTSIAGKFDGYSECWTQESFPTTGLMQLMEITDQLESAKNSRK